MEEYTPKNEVDEMELRLYQLSGNERKPVYDMQDRKPNQKPTPVNKEKAWQGSKRD